MYMYMHVSIHMICYVHVHVLLALQMEVNVGLHSRLSELDSDLGHMQQERDAVRSQLESTCHELSVAQATLTQLQVQASVRTDRLTVTICMCVAGLPWPLALSPLHLLELRVLDL